MGLNTDGRHRKKERNYLECIDPIHFLPKNVYAAKLLISDIRSRYQTWNSRYSVNKLLAKFFILEPAKDKQMICKILHL